MNLLEERKTWFLLAVLTFAVVSLGVLSVAGNSPKSVFAQQRFDVGDGGSTKGTEFKHPDSVEEGDTFNYKFMVPIPQPEAGGEPVKEVGGDTGIADYINILYLFGLGIGGVLAFVALVYGGFLWTVSGAVGKQSQAKSIIGNALLGLAILATSYIILHTVNPDLVGPLKAEKKSHEITLSGESCPVFSKESKEKAAQCCQGIKATGDCSNYVLEGSGRSLGSWQWACRRDECDVCGEEDSLQGLVEHEASGRCKPQLSPVGGWECVAASDSICPDDKVYKEYSVPNLVHEEGVNGEDPEPDLCEGKDCTDEKDCTIDYCNSSTGECEHFDVCGGYAQSCVCAKVGEDGELDPLYGDWGCVNCEAEFVSGLGGYDSEAGFEFKQCANIECTGGDDYCTYEKDNQGDPCEQYDCDDCNRNCYECNGTKCVPVKGADCGIKESIDCGSGQKCKNCKCCKINDQECSSSDECCSGFCGNDTDEDGYFEKGAGECMEKPEEFDCNDDDPIEHPGQNWYFDFDEDGYPLDPAETNLFDINEKQSCERPGGKWFTEEELESISELDCDDEDSSINSGADEVCDDVDHDCDGDPCNGIDPGECKGCCEDAEYKWDNEGFCCGDDSNEYWTTEGVGAPACCQQEGKCIDKSGKCRRGEEGKGIGQTCDDGIDNDCDGKVDCADGDCMEAECTLARWCHIGKCEEVGCVETGERDCSDNNPCTKDSCDEVVDRCFHKVECDGSTCPIALDEDYCDNCVNSCQDYEKYKNTSDVKWEDACTSDSCSVSSTGCKIHGFLGKECRPKQK